MARSSPSTATSTPLSTVKFLQAIAVLRSGVELDGEQLVLAAASHTGTAEHVRVVRAILDRAGLSEDALQCPADWPGDRDARRAADAPHRITMNCSGKHAAFLLACVTNGWPTDTYLEPRHPLQQLISRTIEDFTGETIEHSGVDGCGAPVHAVTLHGLATAIARVSGGTEDNAARVAAAIREHSWALDTPTTARLIDELGLLAKNGAEGVFVAGTAEGTAVALKIADGSSRASIPVALSLLGEYLDGVAVDAILTDTTEQVRGGGHVVGEIRSTV
jgi:L-asparaginase II